MGNLPDTANTIAINLGLFASRQARRVMTRAARRGDTGLSHAVEVCAVLIAVAVVWVIVLESNFLTVLSNRFGVEVNKVLNARS